VSLKERVVKSIFDTVKNIKNITPMLLAVILLIGIFKSYVTPKMLHTFFNGQTLHDVFTAAIGGGVSVGQPFLSYIIGGELLKEGVSLQAVVAFVLSFVTLGVVQLPFEVSVFGAKFTIVRNLLSFIFLFFVSFATAMTLTLFGHYIG